MIRHAIGDMWQFVARNGDTGRLWLDSRAGDYEIWVWTFTRGGVVVAGDLESSKREAIKECAACFACHREHENPVFRKVKYRPVRQER
jgi:hypothetical protein